MHPVFFTRGLALLYFATMFSGSLFAWEAKVFQVSGKKVTIATRQSAGIGLGARLYILSNGSPVGQGRVTGVFHTKVELVLSSGSAQKDNIATDRLPAGDSAAAPAAAAPKSLNLSRWISRPIPKASSWSSIAYGNGVFVMLPFGDADEALVSSDGIRWSLHKLPAPQGNWVLTFGNGMFVAFGGVAKKDSQGLIVSFVGISITSTDGKKWTYTEVPKLGNNWYEIIYGNGMFLASGGGYTNSGDSLDVFASSPDGVEWQVYERRGDGRHWVVGGNGVFASLNPYAGEAGFSPDGRQWRFQKLAGENFDKITFGGGAFLIGRHAQKPLFSENGADWAESQRYAYESWKHLIFYGDKFMGVNESHFGYSTDGFEWKKVELPSRHSHHCKIACSEKRCVIQRYGADHVLTTP